MAVGGNAAVSVVRAAKAKNEAGVAVPGEPKRIAEVRGWLDYQAGQPSHLAYQAKLADTTHVLMCDYDPALAELKTQGLSAVVGGEPYEVLLIDDPMGMHGHLEIYLRYVGA